MAQVVVRCADELLNQVVNKKFADAVVLAELGGIKWYLSRDTIEELFEKIEFLIEHTNPKALALISHTDCSLYREIGETDESHYRDDLDEAASELSERFPELKVTSYLYSSETKQLEKIDPSL